MKKLAVILIGFCLWPVTPHAQSAALDRAVREGLALYEAGRYSDALPFMKKALELGGRELGPDHPGTAALLNNMAALHLARGRLADADPLYERALAIREKALGPEHPDTAQSLNNLARLYDLRGRSADAEPLYKRALAILEGALGPDHAHVAFGFNNLALLYQGQGGPGLREVTGPGPEFAFPRRRDPSDAWLVRAGRGCRGCGRHSLK